MQSTEFTLENLVIDVQNSFFKVLTPAIVSSQSEVDFHLVFCDITLEKRENTSTYQILTKRWRLDFSQTPSLAKIKMTYYLQSHAHAKIQIKME